ncbi:MULTISPECIES: MFS transporter [Mesorhizobium]|uniref:MFS transporter n=1 Tax=Mesorhizobium denitrificans TaxID=2294114 RepID=A0A371XEF5_9HYPH|nr:MULTISPECIES: MFS transporter [Mesorhizobium]RFC67615.1 MFS transporter [Mesorhizobium denitrificans]
MQGTAADIDGQYAWYRLGISILLATIGCAGMWIVVVVMPEVQAEFGIDRAQASLPFTATMIGFAAGNVIVGRAIDRMGYFLPALVASLTLSAGLILASLSTTSSQFSLAHGALIGLGSSAMFGPLIADISHWFRKRRGVAVTAAASGNYLSGAIWPIIMPHLMDAYGWRGAYAAIGVFCAVTMIPLLMLLRRRIDHNIAMTAAAQKQTQSIAAISPRALQALLVVAGFGCCMAMSMPQVHIVAYCMDLGYGIARGSEMLSLMLVGGVVSRLVSGVVADRIGGIRTLLIGSVAQCLALFAYIPFDGLASLYIVSLIFGLSQGGIVPCYAIIVREYMPPAEAGRRIGLVMMSTIIGMSVGGWMTGWIYVQTGSYTVAFLNGIAWNLVNITAMLWMLSKSRPRQTPALA